MERTLIEEKTVQHLKLFLEVSEEAKKEKLAIPPINKLLYWWTRKPLIVSRAVTLLSLAPSKVSIESVKPLLHLNKDKRAFYHSLDRREFAKIIQNSWEKLKILDPFAGAGNLVFEAARAGLDCTVVEYNPVAYLLLRATLEYPAKYGAKLAEDVKQLGEEVIKRVEKELGDFYKRDGRKALHYLWCWCIRCPYCGQRVPLTNNMWLDRRRNIGYRVIPSGDGDFRIEIGEVTTKEGSSYTQKEGRAVCIRCRNAISYEQMTKDIAKRKDKEMIAVVVKDIKGKNYELPTERDREGFEKARRRLLEEWEDLLKHDLIPQEEMKEYELYSMTNYGFKKWYEIFNERQLLLMCTLLKTIKEVCAEISDKEYAKAIATYLGFVLCKHIDRNCIGTRWDSAWEKVADTLSFKSPSFIKNFAETNPFEKTSGSLTSMLEDITDAVQFAANNVKGSVETVLGSALHLEYMDKFDIVLTDPPYLDDVPYGEASEFFYVWLIRLLKEFYPELPDRVPLEEDLVLSEGRFGGNSKLAMEFYRRGMEAAFKNIYNVLKDDGLLVVFFAHSSTKAWELLIDVLRKAKFRVISSYAVHTESTENILARGKTSFMSSIVLACRKNLEDEEAYFEDIMPKMVERIRELIDGLDVDDLLGLPITDLLIMAYGAVLEETTRYTKLKSYRADFKPSFEELVKEARDVILREVVKKLTGTSPAVLGPETSFALIGKIFYRGVMPSDEALKAAKAYGLSINDIAKSGYVEKTKGKDGVVRIKPFSEARISADPAEIDRNNVYEQLLYLEKVASQKGVSEVRKALSLPNFRVGELRSIVSVLLKHYGLLRNKGIALRDDEKEELNVLQTLSDVFQFQTSPRHQTLDDYT